MRAVLDTNVLVSALLSPSGTPGRVLEVWYDGTFELIVSPLLLAELERVLTYPRLRTRIERGEVSVALAKLTRAAVTPDAPQPAPRTRDPHDDYLVALAEQEGAVLVSGDRDLLDMETSVQVMTPAEFLELLLEQGR